eukprot:4915884-Pleurochrysis_carterae.AAC.3
MSLLLTQDDHGELPTSRISVRKLDAFDSRQSEVLIRVRMREKSGTSAASAGTGHPIHVRPGDELKVAARRDVHVVWNGRVGRDAFQERVSTALQEQRTALVDFRSDAVCAR